MATFIKPQTKHLVIELTNSLDPQEEYIQMFLSILYLLRNQDSECIDTNMNYWAINLLENLLPNHEQAKRMFAEPDETLKELNQLKREHFEVSERLRVLKEKEAV